MTGRNLDRKSAGRSMARYCARVVGLADAWSRVDDIARFCDGKSMAITLLNHWDMFPPPVPEPRDDFEASRGTLVGGPWSVPHGRLARD